MNDERGPAPVARWTDTLREGLRTVVLRNPRWGGRPAGGGFLVAGLGLAPAGGAPAPRWGVAGPAEVAWWTWGTGWLATVLLIAACGLATRGRTDGPGAGTAFAWTLVPVLVLGVPALVAHVALVRDDALTPGLAWAIWGAGAVWPALATATLLARLAPRWTPRAGVLALVVAMVAATQWFPRQPGWYAADVQAPAEPGPPPLTQDALEAQSRALVAALDAVAGQRPGVVDLYAITFAPFAGEDVFRREVTMVDEVLRTRLDAGGRPLALLNPAGTVADGAGAAPLSLRRGIPRMAARMDVHEDVLFLHLTSHGARDGQLSAGFEPLAVDAVTPGQLRRWLDEAGVRHAVVSISACFSGSWIPPLAAPGTLVMTAADATHTSYGCGRLSPLTFFGRAVYDEQLRQHTRSFEAAHAAALPVIARREVEAGKSDGPSNPQIRVGEAIRPRLAALVERLEREAR